MSDRPASPRPPGRDATHARPARGAEARGGDRVAGVLRPFIQIGGFLRKESGEIGRQPRLLLVLVVGPFLVLFLFAVGYDTQQAVLGTVFVGPDDSLYEESLDQYTDALSFYVTNEGYTSDLVEARRRLDEGEVDLIVVFPPDPAEAVLRGEQASISILHDTLDPIHQTAVEIAAQVAVQELNATVLTEVLASAQASLVPYGEGITQASDEIEALDAAVAEGDDEEIARQARAVAGTGTALATLLEATEVITLRLRGDLPPGQAERLEDASTAVGALADAASRIADDVDTAGTDVDAADVAELRRLLGTAAEHGDEIVTLDPAVVARPFASEAASLLQTRVDVDEFFAPAALALLLQHMMLTFAAMSLVTDRAGGLFEIYRVGPIGPVRILAGKLLSYLVLGSGVAALLFLGITAGLDVPMRGDLRWAAAGIGGLLASSVCAGLLLSMVARSETQAVQYAMLSLLAGLFFGGFLLDHEALEQPVRALSWVLPVTYGVRLLRDVMLRGDVPETTDLVGLATTAVVYALGAWLLLRRSLRIR